MGLHRDDVFEIFLEYCFMLFYALKAQHSSKNLYLEIYTVSQRVFVISEFTST